MKIQNLLGTAAVARYAELMDDPETYASAPARKGPATWAAVGVLGGASLVGLAWAVLGPWRANQPPVQPPVAAPLVAPAQPPVLIVNVPPPVVPVVTEIGSEPAPAGPPAATVPASTPVPLTSPSLTPETKPAAKGLTTKININTATIEELDLLPGVGKATAQAILDYRTKHGKFRTIADLDKVSGIGPAKLEKIRPLVTVE